MKAKLLIEIKEPWGPNGFSDGHVHHKKGDTVDVFLWCKAGAHSCVEHDIYSTSSGFLISGKNLEL